MDTLQTLGTAMGLSMLAGINLYLTVFVTGLAIQLNWITLSPGLEKLTVLADPVVLTIAGVLLVIEMIIDKCPYADSGWDSIHTIIRPIGGAILGLKALGQMNPAAEVIGTLLCGSIAFTSHTAKAGTRLLVNTSPEPFSNIGMSIGEDVFVLGFLWFVHAHPVITLFIVTALVVAFWYFAPKFFRVVRASWTGIIHRLRARRHAVGPDAELPKRLPEFAQDYWTGVQKPGEQIAWAIPCFSGRMRSMGRNVRGCLIGTTSDRLVFIGKKNFRPRMTAIALWGAETYEEPGAVFHRLGVTPAAGDAVRVRVTRKFSPYLPKAMQWIRERSRPASIESSAPVRTEVPAAMAAK